MAFSSHTWVSNLNELQIYSRYICHRPIWWTNRMSQQLRGSRHAVPLCLRGIKSRSETVAVISWHHTALHNGLRWRVAGWKLLCLEILNGYWMIFAPWDLDFIWACLNLLRRGSRTHRRGYGSTCCSSSQTGRLCIQFGSVMPWMISLIYQKSVDEPMLKYVESLCFCS